MTTYDNSPKTSSNIDLSSEELADIVRRRDGLSEPGRVYQLDKVRTTSGRQKTVYIGLDMHKRSVTYHVLFEDGEKLEGSAFKRHREQVERLVRKYTEQGYAVRVAFEAGPTGYTWAEELRELEGCEVLVAATVHIRSSLKDRATKTDKRDAKLIAEELRSGQLVSIAELSVRQQRLRAVQRGIRQLNEKRSETIVQLKSLVLSQDISAPWDDPERKSTNVLVRDLEWLKSDPTGTALDMLLAQMGRTILHLRESIQTMRKDLYNAIRADAELAETFETLCRIDGVGQWTAATWVLETPDLSLFANAERFAAWLGLVPGEHSSGEKQRKGRITRAGNKFLRTALVEIAHQLARKHPGLRAKFERVRARANYQVAIVAVARAFAVRVFAMLRRGEQWRAVELPSDSPQDHAQQVEPLAEEDEVA